MVDTRRELRPEGSSLMFGIGFNNSIPIEERLLFVISNTGSFFGKSETEIMDDFLSKSDNFLLRSDIEDIVVNVF